MKKHTSREVFPQVASMQQFFSYGHPTPQVPFTMAEGGMLDAPMANMASQTGQLPMFSQGSNIVDRQVLDARRMGYMAEGGATNTHTNPNFYTNRLDSFMGKVKDMAARANEKRLLEDSLSAAREQGIFQDGGPNTLQNNTQFSGMNFSTANAYLKNLNSLYEESNANKVNQLYNDMAYTAYMNSDPYIKKIHTYDLENPYQATDPLHINMPDPNKAMLPKDLITARYGLETYQSDIKTGEKQGEDVKPATQADLEARIKALEEQQAKTSEKKSKCESGNCGPEEEAEVAKEEKDIASEAASLQGRLAVMDIKDKYRWNALSRAGNLLSGSSNPGRPGQLRERTYHYEFGKAGQPSQLPGMESMQNNVASNRNGDLVSVNNEDVWKKWQGAPGVGKTNTAPTTTPAATTQKSSYTMPGFDMNRSFGQISNNEQNYFRTESDLTKPWKDQKMDNYGGGLYDSPQKVQGKWNSMLTNEPNKQKVWDSYSNMPAPIKDIAIDHLFNASSDPRIFTLAAAGAIDMKDSMRYKNDPNLLEQVWKDNIDLINQQYNDDPQAFTESVSDYRKILYGKSRTKDVNDQPTDYLSNTGTPGVQYNAWSGRTGATQDYINDTYFNPANGYVAPQFFKKRGGALTKFIKQYAGDVESGEVWDPGAWEVDTGEDFGNSLGLNYQQSGTAGMPTEKGQGENPDIADITTGQDITEGQNFGLGRFIAPSMQMAANRINAAKTKKGKVFNEFSYDQLVNPIQGVNGPYDQFGNQFPDQRNFNMYYGKAGGQMYEEGGVYFLDEATIKQLKEGGAIIEYMD